MRGYLDHNFPAFDAAKKQLVEDGWEVISPADMDRDNGFDPSGEEPSVANLRHMIDRDIQAILWRADAIAMLPNWEQSKGVAVEKALAEFLGLDIYTITDGKLEPLSE